MYEKSGVPREENATLVFVHLRSCLFFYSSYIFCRCCEIFGYIYSITIR